MTGAQLAKIRDTLGLDHTQLAELLNESLDRNYRPDRIKEWERGKLGVPKNVAAFVERIILESGGALPDLEEIAPSPPPGLGSDTPPPAPETDSPQPLPQAPLGSRGQFDKVCTDLWATVALAVSSMGALTGNRALTTDGQIIDGDKEALGRAWGKLAETNETFRNMLMTTITGGAWMEIAIVTGVTANKLVANHRTVAAVARQASEGQDDKPGLHVA